MFLRLVRQAPLQKGLTKLHLSDQGVSAGSPDTASAFISFKEGPKLKEAIFLYRHSRSREQNLGVENR
jgi:hypothetical protein